MAKDLSHIKLFEVEETCGSSCRPLIVLFNQNHISLEDALQYVRAGNYNKDVPVMEKQQWNSLFCNSKQE